MFTQDISYLRNFFLRQKFKSGPLIRTYRELRLVLAKSAQVDGTGALSISKPWIRGGTFPSDFCIEDDAHLSVYGSTDIMADCRVHVHTGAHLSINGIFANTGLRIDCRLRMQLGKGSVFGPETMIRDNDGHKIIGAPPEAAPIDIGEHVWVGARVTILKGVKIGSCSIIGAGSIVTKEIPPNSLACGIPARIIKSGVEWT